MSKNVKQNKFEGWGKMQYFSVAIAVMGVLIVVNGSLKEQTFAYNEFSNSVSPLSYNDTSLRSESNFALLDSPIGKPFSYRFSDGIFDSGFLARGYYSNNQRIQWSGVETILGVEGIITPRIIVRCPDSTIQVKSELYLGQPYDKNFYITGPERYSYAGNFQQEYFEISQLYMAWQKNDFEFRAGKFETPFGRYYFPSMSNNKEDAPFIRSESILWRQTGFWLRWAPTVWEFDAALVNGSTGLDTNSMKAVTGRLGMNFDDVTFGGSFMWQDGIGSEEQKQYSNHIGCDFAFRAGKWVLSFEGIYDEYGLRRDFDPDNIFWEHSIYYRQINKADNVAITGFGFYIDLSHQFGNWLFNVNYGEFHPEKINHPVYPQHDIVNQRILTKAKYSFNKYMDYYVAGLWENGGYVAQCGRDRRGWHLMTGFQFSI